MKHRPWPRVALVLAVVLGLGACKPIPTRPVFRNPVISSVVVFPLLVGQGDSVMVTVVASDPDGDSLVYDWEAYRPLYMTGPYGDGQYSSDRPNRSQVFHCDSTITSSDSCWVACYPRDLHGGITSRIVGIALKH